MLKKNEIDGKINLFFSCCIDCGLKKLEPIDERGLSHLLKSLIVMLSYHLKCGENSDIVVDNFKSQILLNSRELEDYYYEIIHLFK